MVKEKKQKDEKPEGDSLLFEENIENNNTSKKKDTIKDTDSQKQEKKTETKNTEKASKINKSKIIENDDGFIKFNYSNIKWNNIERIIYWIIIIIITILLFTGKGCEINIGPNNTSDNESAPQNNPPQLVDNNNTENSSLEEEQEEETQPEEEEKNTTDIPADVTCDEGDVEVKIKSHDHDENRIESITIEVTNNDNEILNGFYALVEYIEPESNAYIKILKSTEANANDGKYRSTALVPKCGGKRSITFDSELRTHYVTAGEDELRFEAELYEYSNKDEKIASTSKKLSFD